MNLIYFNGRTTTIWIEYQKFSMNIEKVLGISKKAIICSKEFEKPNNINYLLTFRFLKDLKLVCTMIENVLLLLKSACVPY